MDANGDAQEASQFERLPVVSEPYPGPRRQGHSVRELSALRDE
jgi:hypothetical protein